MGEDIKLLRILEPEVETTLAEVIRQRLESLTGVRWHRYPRPAMLQGAEEYLRHIAGSCCISQEAKCHLQEACAEWDVMTGENA